MLLWLEREVAAGRLGPPAVMRVHSGNVAAIRRMEQAIESRSYAYVQRPSRTSSRERRPDR